MLLARQCDLDDLLGDSRVERDAAELPDAGSGAEDLERAFFERRRDLHGDGLVENALAGEAIPLADEVIAELNLVHDRRRRWQARPELDSARGGPTAPATRRGDGDTAGLRRLQNRRPGPNPERPARRDAARIGEDFQPD